MMDVNVNFDNLTRQLLAQHKRTPARLTFIRALLRPLSVLLSSFNLWKKEIRRQLNITGQVGILQGFLRDKYGTQMIRIETGVSRGVPLGLRAEGVENAQPAGLASHPIAVPLRGETSEKYEDADFVVFIPSEIDEEAVRIDVSRYKAALVKFKIIK